MKTYSKPKLEVETIKVEDIMLISGGAAIWGGEDEEIFPL